MGNLNKLTGVISLGLSMISLSSFAAETKGITMSGQVEGGYKNHWQVGNKAEQNFFVDQVGMNLRANISDKTKVNVEKAFVFGGNGPQSIDVFSASNYFNMNQMIGVSTSAALYLNEANLSYKCSDGWHTTVGLFKTPYGMEAMWNKYDMPTYYHSQAYSIIGRQLSERTSVNNFYDLGVKFTLDNIIPGKLEIALMDGRNSTNTTLFMSQAIRYSNEWKSGNMSFTPVVSVFAGKWNAGPKDIGVNVGTMYKMGNWWANAEFNYFSAKSFASNLVDADTTMNLYLEPGIDLNVVNVSAKAEWINLKAGAAAAVDDFNVGLAVNKNWDAYRVRLAMMRTGLAGRLATRDTMDVRLLFGAKF